MTVKAAPISRTEEKVFQTGHVMPIVGSHFVHDVYTASIPALLPAIMEKLSLSLTMVGTLTAILQIPALLNPFIGYLADKVSLRYFVIFAPAVTATIVGGLGCANSYTMLAILLFATGISVACYHAPAPAIIGRVAGNQVGKGMSLFMAAGELARAAGPLMAVWAISMWTLEGFYRVAIFGWIASFILYLRLRSIPARMEKPGDFRVILPVLKSLFLPLLIVIFFRNFMHEALATYLPIYMNSKGASLWIAGGALSILEMAGVAGALSSGTLSDWLGRKMILLAAALGSAVGMLIFLNVEGWLLIPALLFLGFFTLSTAPVMLAMVQDHMVTNRAVGNGLYMMITFFIRIVALVAIGIMGDKFGLEQVYLWSAFLMLLSIPAIVALPERPSAVASI